MGSLFSVFVSILTLFLPSPALSQNTARVRMELARSRQADHAKAIASGDLSRSPYYRYRGPAGQSGSRHDEVDWYRELIAQN